ncbi:MAG: hypothetical protein ACQETL_16225, partial [Bacteroidota bacterium]
MGKSYAQVTVTPADPVDICEDGSFVGLSDITVDEGTNTNAFGTNTNVQIFELAAPTDFSFKENTGTLALIDPNGRFSDTGIEIKQNYIRVYYKLEQTNNRQGFIIRDIEISYTGSTTVSNVDLLRVPQSTGLSFYADADINGDQSGDNISHGDLSTVHPNAGTATNTNVCIDQTSFDLNNTLSGADGGGTWTDAGNNVITDGLIDPNSLGTGTYDYTYTVSAPPCADDTEMVSITVDALPNTGTPNDPDVCETDNNYDLFSAIDGEDSGGTWSSPDGTADAAITNGALDATALTQGNTYDFIYEVSNATGTCTETVTTSITIAASDNPGTPSNGFACIDNSAFDLFTLLSGEDPGGTWLDDNTTGALTDNLVDATQLTAGNTYSFTYEFTGTCTVSSTVELTIEAIPNPGTSTDQTICDTETAFDLSTTLSGHDSGGVWTEITATPSGQLSGSTFDASSAGEGVYDFEYTVSNNSCADESVTVQITVEKSPNAGTASNTSICDTNLAFDLFSTLTGNDSGGTWNDDDGTAALTGSTLDASVAGVGTFDFTYTVAGTVCPDDSETVTIEIVAAPNPGTATNTTVCANSGLFDLFTTLSGHDSGGTWLDDDATAALSGNSLNIDALTTEENYNFTYEVNNGVCTESETVTISIDSQPFAGAAEPPLTLCETNTTVINLYDRITGEDTGGDWTNVDGTAGAAFNVDELDMNSAPTGTHEFVYSVSNTGEKCVTDSISVFITKEALPNAGTASNLTVCETSSSIDLNNRLSDQDGDGTWNDDSGSGALFGGNFFDVSAVAPGDYLFTYTVTGEDCPSDSETVTITVEPSPNAGTATDTTICITENNYDLFTTLDTYDTGGTWSNEDGANGFSGSTLDASVNTAGVYNFTYTVGATACPDDTETVAITIINPETTAESEATPIAGQINFCPQELVLIEFKSNVSGASFNWTKTGDDIGLSSTSGNSSSLNFTTKSNTGSTDLVATIEVTATVDGCTGPPEVFDIIVNPQPTINNYFPPTEVCDGTTDFDLTTLDISVDGSVVADKSDLNFAGDGVDSGAKTFDATSFAPDEVVSIEVTYDNGTDCPTVKDLNLVQVKQNPDIVIDTPADGTAVCVTEEINISATVNDATSSVDWTTDGGGSFNNISLSGGIASATYVPALSDSGNTITLTGTTNDPGAPCAADFDEITIDFLTPPIAEIGTFPAEICSDETLTLIGNISGSADNGEWRRKSGTDGNLSATANNTGDWEAEFDPNGFIGDITFEFVASSPNSCDNVLEETTVSVFEKPTASIPADFNTCGDASFDLTAALGGSATSGFWEIDTGGNTANLTNENTLTATYTPETADYGTDITFRFTAEDPATGGPCGDTTYDVIVTIDEPAFVNITSTTGSNCQNENINLEGTYSGSASSATWSIEPNDSDGYLGEGNISNVNDEAGNISAVYEPAVNDAGNNVTLRLTSSDPGTTCGIVSEDIIYSIDNPPTATITSSTTDVCEDGTITLKGTIDGGATSGDWQIKSGENTTAGTLSSTSLVSGEFVATYEPNGSYYGSIIFQFVAETTNSCQEAIEEDTIDIYELPKASMTGPTNSCGTDVIDLRADFEGSTVTGNWVIESGNGSLDNTNTTSTYSTVDYLPVEDDYGTTVTVKYRALTAGAPNPCPEQFYPIDVFIDTPPTADAGTDDEVCVDTPYTVGDAAATNYSAILWTHNGNGSLTDDATLNPTYTPGAGDEASTVTLTMTVSGNGSCTDSVDTKDITITDAPTADAGAADEVCVDTPYTVGDAAAANDNGILWTDNGNGTLADANTLTPTYSPDPTDAGNVVTLTMTVSGNGSCDPAVDTKEITITPAPTADAGAADEVCVDTPYTVGDAAATNDSAILWTHNGNGSLTDDTTLTPTYTPGAGDEASSVTLTMTVSGNGSCDPAVDTKDITITDAPTADAGADDEVCVDTPYTVGDASATNDSAILWTHNGNGSLTDDATLTPTYTPGTGDEASSVTLTMTVSGNGSCTEAVDTKDITITDVPTADAGADDEVCVDTPYTVGDASATNDNGILWTHNGNGSLTDETTITPTYTPGTGDEATTVTLTMTVSGNGSCTEAVDTKDITITDAPTADAGTADEVCVDTPYTVGDAGATNDNGILWTDNGNGSLTDANTLTPTYSPDPTDAGNVVTLTMTVSGNGSCDPAVDTKE